MHENDIGTEIVDAAYHTHVELGPGLLERVYEVVMAYELRKRGLHVDRQVPIPIKYEEVTFDEGYRADLTVENKVIVELKSREAVSRADKKQILTHIRLADKRLGYLINFGEALIKDGITRAVNGLEE